MESYIYSIGRFGLLIFLIAACSSEDAVVPIDCDKSTLDLSLDNIINATSCTAIDGAITVSASGGVEPYTYSIDGNSNTSGIFQNLKAGNYEVKIFDANTCERMLEIIVPATGSTLALMLTATPDTECLADNGVISAIEQGGVGPYMFRLNNGAFGSSPNFSGLKAGEYSIEVKDSEGCSFSKKAKVEKGQTGISFSADIQSIIATKCALSGCHNGDNGADRNWTIFSNVKANASSIKTRTGNRSMPQTGSLTQDQINLIACWVDDGAKDN